MSLFNPDGSLQLPEKLAKKKSDEEHRMHNADCMTIRKEKVNNKPPKSCNLHITLSKKITKNEFITNIFTYFNTNSQTPSKITQISDHDFIINIGTDFRRCSDCSLLISRYKEFLNSNIIENHGNCEYQKNRQANFSYEDYFD